MNAEELRRHFKVGSKEHEALKRRLMDRLQMSQRDMTERYGTLSKNEEQYNAFVKVKETDQIRKNAKSLAGVQDYVTIEVPYTYAVLMTAHTYYTSVFLGRNPILQVEGLHGEGEEQVQAVEALLNYQVNTGGMNVPLFFWLFDPGKYGFGVIGRYWEKEIIRTRTFELARPSFLGFTIPGKKGKMEPVIKETVGYEGSRLFNVRPQDWFPDTRVPLHAFQRGEFVGRYVEVPWYMIYEGAIQGRYFNLDALQREGRQGPFSGSAGQGMTRDLGSPNVTTLPGENGHETVLRDTRVGVVKGYEIQVRLVPQVWGLGDELGYENWAFNISDGGVVFGAAPLGNLYNEFDYDIIQIEPEAYSLFPLSAAERVSPLNDVMSWLINTHFYNVRQTLNNQFIVDPSRVVMGDLEDPRPGKLIRLKPTAYGQDVRTLLQQLPVGDITRGHLADAQPVADMIQRTLGVSDNIMGMVNSGGRKTATEVRSSNTFGINRMKTTCEFFSMLGWAPMTKKLIQSAQGRYDVERMMKVVGDTASGLPEFANVTPEAIAGFYSFVPVDGTLPIDRYAQAQLWQNLLAQVRNYPQIMQQYDFARIFGWVAGIAGLKNVHRFKVQVVPDGMMQRQVQAGNAIPLAAAEQDLGRVPDGNRPNDMGATG